MVISFYPWQWLGIFYICMLELFKFLLILQKDLLREVFCCIKNSPF